MALWRRMERENDSLSADNSQPASIFEIDRLTHLLMPAGYSWPASGLIGYDMARLQALKQRTKKPITQLVRDAVNLLFELTPDAMQTPVAEPIVSPTEVVEPARSPKEIVAEYLQPVKQQMRTQVQRTLFDANSLNAEACAEGTSKEPREIDHRASAG